MGVDEARQKGAMLTINRRVSSRCIRDETIVNDHRAFISQRFAVKHFDMCYGDCFRHT